MSAKMPLDSRRNKIPYRLLIKSGPLDSTSLRESQSHFAKESNTHLILSFFCGGTPRIKVRTNIMVQGSWAVLAPLDQIQNDSSKICESLFGSLTGSCPDQELSLVTVVNC